MSSVFCHNAAGEPTDGGLFRAYPQRFFVLALFAGLSMMQGFSWFLFAPIVGPTKDTFTMVTDDTLTLLDAWSPIMYIPMAFVVQYLLHQPDGLQRVVQLGATMGFLGGVARCLALADKTQPRAVYCLHLAQILNGLSAPTVIAPPSLLSALWFPPRESTRATAVAVLANNLGNALAFLTVPYIVYALGGIPTLFVVVALGHFLLLCASASFPKQPPSPPSAAACTLMLTLSQSVRVDPPDGPPNAYSDVCDRYRKPETGMLHDIRGLAAIPSFLGLCLVYSWSSGAFVSWTSLFDTTLTADYTDTFIGYLSFGCTLAYIAGGLVSSWVVDNYLPHRMKAVLLWSCVASLVLAALFCLSVPSLFCASEEGIFGLGKGWLLFIAILAGFPNGAAAPIFYEFAAQLSFPISEGSSASMLSLFENFGALFLYEVVARLFGPPSINLLFTVGMGACCAALFFVKEEYRKREAEDEMTDTIMSRLSVYSISSPLGYGTLEDAGGLLRRANSAAGESAPLLST